MQVHQLRGRILAFSMRLACSVSVVSGIMVIALGLSISMRIMALRLRIRLLARACLTPNKKIKIGLLF